MDSTGKKITFYPSSLMLSHNVKPLLFFSDTRLMYLTTRLRPISPGPSFHIHNNCSIPQTEFFNSLLHSILSTHKVITRLLSMSSFSNLLECDSYLRRYYAYSTGLTSRMMCPRHYQPTVQACKTWALRNCRGLSAHERMFLEGHSRQRRSSFMCHAGLFGILRKIYTALGHSCESNHVTHLKDALRSMYKSLSVSQSLFCLFNGKLVYLFKTADTLTTRTNRLSQDLRTIDHTFSLWQTELKKFSEQSECHESVLLEFLSKHSNAVNRALVALLRLTEIQDVLHQFAALETKTLFGFPHLPTFLHPQILRQFTTDVTMQYTAKALDEGFPLFINLMIDIEHEGPYVEASVLLTLPVVPDETAFCTIEYLMPVKFNNSNTCYTGPVTQENLVILTCPHSRHLLTTASLNKCYQDNTAFICPTHVLTLATNITWLGFPFNPDTKLTFPRNHVPATDCANLHPLLHLGGRMFLATTSQELNLPSGSLVRTPLAVYRFPCNETLTGLALGLGTCPARITVTVTMASPFQLQFTPWAPVLVNESTTFRSPVLDIPPPAHLNQSVLNDLETTFSTLDGQLSDTIRETNQHIADIQDSSATTTTAYVAYFALALSLLSCLVSTIFICVFRQLRRSSTDTGHADTTTFCDHCRRPRQEVPPATRGDVNPPTTV